MCYNCFSCKTKQSDLGVHYFNSDELLCLKCAVKRDRKR